MLIIPMEIKPTQGRIVLFTNAEDVVYPAMVTAVNEDESLGLTVFSKDGIHFFETVTQGTGANQWDWMQFQKDQQARLADEATAAETAVADQTEQVAQTAPAPEAAQTAQTAPAPEADPAAAAAGDATATAPNAGQTTAPAGPVS